MPSDYEKFQQRMFDELEDLERFEQQRIISEFVKAGQQCGVDVMSEILDKARLPSEVMAEIRQKTQG